MTSLCESSVRLLLVLQLVVVLGTCWLVFVVVCCLLIFVVLYGCCCRLNLWQCDEWVFCFCRTLVFSLRSLVMVFVVGSTVVRLEWGRRVLVLWFLVVCCPRCWYLLYVCDCLEQISRLKRCPAKNPSYFKWGLTAANAFFSQL